MFSRVWKMFDSSVYSATNFLHFTLDVKEKRFLTEIGVYDFPWGLQPHCGVQLGVGEHVRESCAQVVPIFGVKTRAFNKIETAAYDIASGKSWTINLK